MEKELEVKLLGLDVDSFEKNLQAKELSFFILNIRKIFY